MDPVVQEELLHEGDEEGVEDAEENLVFVQDLNPQMWN